MKRFKLMCAAVFLRTILNVYKPSSRIVGKFLLKLQFQLENFLHILQHLLFLDIICYESQERLFEIFNDKKNVKLKVPKLN